MKRDVFILALLSACIVFNSVAMGYTNIMVGGNNGVTVITRDVRNAQQKRIAIHVAQADMKERKDPKIEKLIGLGELAGAALSFAAAYKLKGAALHEVQDIGCYLLGNRNAWSGVQKRFLPMLGCVSATVIGGLLGYDANKRFKS